MYPFNLSMKHNNYICYFNGSCHPIHEVHFHISDLSILRGYGIFDYLRMENKKPFLLDRYIDRFFHSAELINLTVPITKQKLSEVVHELLKKNPPKNYGIRFILTGGKSEDGFSPGTPSLAVLIEDIPSVPASYYEEGVKTAIQQYQRDMPKIKNLYYANAVKNSYYLKKNNFVEVIYHHQGCVLEASRCNVFIVKDNILFTAKKNILNGITRQFVIETASEKYQVREEEVSIHQLYAADEVFLTSSNKKLLPVVEVQGAIIKKGKVGPVSKDLMKMLSKKTTDINPK